MQKSKSTALAAIIHDPEGNMLPAIERIAEPFAAMFGGLVMSLTDTSAGAMKPLLEKQLGAKVLTHPTGDQFIGLARRNVVIHANGFDQALYCDFDHVLRWLEAAPEDLQRTLDQQPETDLLIVGRTHEALHRGPARLRQTETIVNHIFELATGLDWDLLFSIRRLSPTAIDLIAKKASVNTIGTDMEWPMLARAAGLKLGYLASDALDYRTIEEFDSEADTGDSDPMQWIRRMELVSEEAAVLKSFLTGHRSFDVR
ncbi:MAG: hypothetical protein KDJ19_13430 [Hyphomicrobiaceae bacterium]|nr:hypothetical protein [Hyphomicrobiaceae bacterium]MCC0025121.1 hypothetical protein [Hyphomicrobiaceae bacterium]